MCPFHFLTPSSNQGVSAVNRIFDLIIALPVLVLYHVSVILSRKKLPTHFACVVSRGYASHCCAGPNQNGTAVPSRSDLVRVKGLEPS